MADFNQLNLNWQVNAEVDEDKCIGCGKCIISCRDSEVDCIEWVTTADARRVAHVKADDCIGCDLCSIVCPVDDCISMVEVANGRPYVSWGDVTTALGAPGSCTATSKTTWENFEAGTAELNVESPAHRYGASQVPTLT